MTYNLFEKTCKWHLFSKTGCYEPFSDFYFLLTWSHLCSVCVQAHMNLDICKGFMDLVSNVAAYLNLQRKPREVQSTNSKTSNQLIMKRLVLHEKNGAGHTAGYWDVCVNIPAAEPIRCSTSVRSGALEEPLITLVLIRLVLVPNKNHQWVKHWCFKFIKRKTEGKRKRKYVHGYLKQRKLLDFPSVIFSIGYY